MNFIPSRLAEWFQKGGATAKCAVDCVNSKDNNEFTMTK